MGAVPEKTLPPAEFVALLFWSSLALRDRAISEESFTPRGIAECCEVACSGSGLHSVLLELLLIGSLFTGFLAVRGTLWQVLLAGWASGSSFSGCIWWLPSSAAFIGYGVTAACQWQLSTIGLQCSVHGAFPACRLCWHLGTWAAALDLAVVQIKWLPQVME